MAELTLIINDWGHRELKDYLLSLNGVLEVIINDEKQLVIYIKYNPNLIGAKVLKMEILLFLDIKKYPVFFAFDRHPSFETLEYKIERKDICCEYCFTGAIDELFEIDGIEKVNSNFYEEYFLKRYDERDAVIIDIKYNPKKISLKELKQIEENLNL